jgi:hypothetical protein
MMTMRHERSLDRDGIDALPAGQVRLLMVDRNILALWADAARQRQAERMQHIADLQGRRLH